MRRGAQLTIKLVNMKFLLLLVMTMASMQKVAAPKAETVGKLARRKRRHTPLPTKDIKGSKEVQKGDWTFDCNGGRVTVPCVKQLGLVEMQAWRKTIKVLPLPFKGTTKCLDWKANEGTTQWAGTMRLVSNSEARTPTLLLDPKLYIFQHMKGTAEKHSSARECILFAGPDEHWGRLLLQVGRRGPQKGTLVKRGVQAGREPEMMRFSVTKQKMVPNYVGAHVLLKKWKPTGRSSGDWEDMGKWVIPTSISSNSQAFRGKKTNPWHELNYAVTAIQLVD